MIQDAIRKRIRHERGAALIQSADEAARLIKDGMVLGLSGFTPSDHPKKVPLALVKRKKAGEALQVDIYTGATVGEQIDKEMAEAGLIRKRLPFCNNPVMRKSINKGELAFTDLHLSQVAQYLNYGFLPSVDMAIVEVLAITEEGDLIPGTAVGNTAAFVQNADRIIVEIALKKPLALEGMHDIYFPGNPPGREPIPLMHPADRIGITRIPCGWDKIQAIVLSEEADSPRVLAPIDDVSRKMSENVIHFFKNEVRTGRLTNELLPLQSGLGNVANAVLMGLLDSPFQNLTAYTEVVQDAMLALLDRGKMKNISATSFTLSPEGWDWLYREIDFFKDKIILRPEEISNHPEIVRRIGVIAINTALEADIYGNINSSQLLGKNMMNGIGGSGDFSRNAAISIFTTPSVAKDGKVSAIVPMCSHVDHTEHEVSVLVTEQGYADLRGLSPKERAVQIIEHCVHPDYRDQMMDYFRRACRQSPCQTPHILDEALSWHSRYEKTGTMRIQEKTACTDCLSVL